MSTTNQSNSGAAASNQQEIKNPMPRNQEDASGGDIRGVQNGRYQEGSVVTVLLGGTSALLTAIYPRTVITAIEKQHRIYGAEASIQDQFVPLRGQSTLVAPIEATVWGEPGQILTAKFFDKNTFANSPTGQTLRNSNQFYSIGLVGAQRPELYYKFTGSMERPYAANDATNPIINIDGATGTGLAAGPWVCKMTVYLYNNQFVAANPLIYMVDTNQVDYNKLKREAEKAEEVKRIKRLTIPTNME